MTEETSVYIKQRQWGNDRNIINGTTPFQQFGKLLEEVAEMYKAMVDNNIVEIKDGIGDARVVLNMIAAQYGLLVEDCDQYAYDQIKDRKGKIINGVFVKGAE
jgi:hypothetical protein